MKIIAHRINTIEQLLIVPKYFGIELDIRYHNDELILHHEPFSHNKEPYPCKFEEILRVWTNTGPMILNVKTEGVELACIALMRKYKINDWFFLDLSMPYFAVYSEKAFKREIDGFNPDNIAVRFSEREPLEYALAFKGKASWVWVDCFTKIPLNMSSYNKLKSAGYKICLVAPELQHHPAEYATEFQNMLRGMEIDAVCTKRPDLWQK